MLPFYIINKVPFLKIKLYKLYSQRAEIIVPKILPYIKKSDKIIDIGCGTGAISRLINKTIGIKITLADVQYNVMCDQYPVIVYNGENLPYPDNHFSASLLITVLHHCQNPKKVMDEAIRVTNGRIIVVEDIFTNVFGRIITFIGDCLVNWEIHSPFTNDNKKGWLKKFKSRQLTVIYQEEFTLRCIGIPFKLAVFVLEKNNSN